jgi:hypothetical protein
MRLVYVIEGLVLMIMGVYIFLVWWVQDDDED